QRALAAGGTARRAIAGVARPPVRGRGVEHLGLESRARVPAEPADGALGIAHAGRTLAGALRHRVHARQDRTAGPRSRGGLALPGQYQPSGGGPAAGGTHRAGAAGRGRHQDPLPGPGLGGCRFRASPFEAVDAMNEAAAHNGSTADINPRQDLGFMYNRNLADPDGHLWEAMWMDVSAMPDL